LRARHDRLCDARFSESHAVTARRGPSVAKAAHSPLLQHGSPRVRAVDARWRALFDAADTMSEGAIREEADGRVWYGTTSLILEFPTSWPEEERALAFTIAERDVHVRVRSIRAAMREAQSRAPGTLGRVIAETRVTRDPRGLRIDVDIQAPLIETRLEETRSRR
jgi:hypothetical protein